jgi:predicted CoA-binding protein
MSSPPSRAENEAIDEAGRESFPASDAPAHHANTQAFANPPDEALRELLVNTKTIAVVGASSNPERTSRGIMQKLLSVGYRVIPVNPNETAVLGQKAYPSLAALAAQTTERIDIVNVFRRAEETPSIADEAVKIGAKALWLQQGITSELAAARASAGGLTVVMDLCIGVMHSALRVPKQ